MPKKIYSVWVSASPKYPIEETISVEANNFPMACQKAIKQYFKKHKKLKSTFCNVKAIYVGKKVELEEEE